MAEKKRRPNPEQLGGNALDVAKNLIADMIGDRDYSAEQGHFRLKPEMLPDEMAFERAALRIMESFVGEGIPPTKDNLLLRLSLEYEDASTRMSILLSHKSKHRNITSLAMGLSEYTGRAKIALALTEAQKVLRQGGLSNVAAYEEITHLLSSSAPRNLRATTRTADSLFDEFIEYQRQMAEQYANGVAIGPNFPWQGLNELLPYINPGDMCLIGAQTGFGKSVVAQMLSEHIAHVVGGYDVGFFHLETTGLDFMMRRMCRVLPIHGSDLMQTRLVERHIQKRLQELSIGFSRLQREKGEIFFEPAAGISWEEFKNRVIAGKIRAEAQGKRYVCIVDYYQKFGSQGFSNRTEAYNQIAENLKDLAQQLEIYMIVFSQEQPHTQKSPNNPEATEGDLSSWGGNVINFQSQVIIRLIRRRNVEADKPWIADDGVTPMRDILGKAMYFHRRGQIDSVSKFKVIKASFGQIGDAPVLFANGFFNIMDALVETVDFTD